MVDSAPDLEVAGEPANGREAVALAGRTRADVGQSSLVRPGDLPPS